jgi:hypothetical protein
MRDLWGLVGQLSDDDFAIFVGRLHEAWLAGDLFLRVTEGCEKALEAHEDCRAALTRLRESAARMQQYLDPVGLWHFEAQPLMNEALNLTEKALANEARRAQREMKEWRDASTRKVAGVRHLEFIGLAVDLMNNHFKQPHYELVGDMVAVLFDKEMDKEAIRSAARKFADRRAAAYSRLEAPSE